MPTTSALKNFFPAMIEERLFNRESNLQFHQQWLFRGVELRDRTMLDIGSGAGLNGFYAACQGAREVVCVEPEGPGCSGEARRKFERLRRRLGLENVKFVPQRFQDFDPQGQRFDLVLMHNSVNHLDEPACVNLLTDPASLERYRALFEKVAAATAPGGTLILSDCSRHNFFDALGLTNPIMPTIEWHKHQSPKVWAALLEEAGFAEPHIRWSSFNRLGRPGELLLGNRFMSYFLKSHFSLNMRRRDSAREGER